MEAVSCTRRHHLWTHILRVTSPLFGSGDRPAPVCVDGENACSPEDVGGPGGYAVFRQIISQPDHPEYEQWITIVARYVCYDNTICSQWFV
ncbi:IS1096 element passenger TnpR family protein [Kyrpidia tusciae]|uniref:IS1096 element passenger TnpR family protein n=1 Tax=Kyrpidia tusciae TaxID=33943 RepID=UPI000A016DBB